MVDSGFLPGCFPVIPRELHLSSLVWRRLFLSPPQSCVVYSWSRETSVILTVPWQVPHANRQLPSKHTRSSSSRLVTGTLALTPHPRFLVLWPALPPVGTTFLHLPASPHSHAADTEPVVPVCAVMPSWLEQEDWRLGDAKEGLTAELQVVSTCWGVNTSLPLWVGIGLGWTQLEKAARTSPPLGYEWDFL